MDIAAATAASRAACGLPPRVADPAILARLGLLVRAVAK
jgi:hypothetical protein